MKPHILRYILAACMLATCTLSSSAKDYQAVVFGAKSDGVTLNTQSIQRAIDHIAAEGGGRLIFTVGRYLTGAIQLKSNVTLHIGEGATLVAAPSIYDMLTGIFENIETIQASHNAANKNIYLDVGVGDLQLPLHPGAEAFWREQGYLD